jgi:hypothetical protein
MPLRQTCSYSCDLSVGELSAPKDRRSFQSVNIIATRSIGLALNGSFCVDQAGRRGSRDQQAGSTQQGPVVMAGNEPKPRGCSDGAIRRSGGCPQPIPALAARRCAFLAGSDPAACVEGRRISAHREPTGKANQPANDLCQDYIFGTYRWFREGSSRPGWDQYLSPDRLHCRTPWALEPPADLPASHAHTFAASDTSPLYDGRPGRCSAVLHTRCAARRYRNQPADPPSFLLAAMTPVEREGRQRHGHQEDRQGANAQHGSSPGYGRTIGRDGRGHGLGVNIRFDWRELASRRRFLRMSALVGHWHRRALLPVRFLL